MKTSIAVLSVFLGSASAIRRRRLNNEIQNDINQVQFDYQNLQQKEDVQFVTGWNTHTALGESLTMKGNDKGQGDLENYNFNQFATGMLEKDDDKEELTMKGNDRGMGALEGFKFAQTTSPFGLAGDKGPAMPSPQPKVRGEKQWQTWAQNLEDWGHTQEDVANTRIPYASTLLQTQSPFGLAGDKGPALPSGQPKVRGEKQWQTWAQNLEDWGKTQEEVANTRIPYASTLVQTEAQSPFGLAGAGGPALPSGQPKIRGEKQWQTWAQNLDDWGNQQVDVANTRIPYASTLLQTNEQSPFGLAGDKGPAMPSPQPKIRGEKQWQTWAQNLEDWGKTQEEVANTRIPYASTLVQLKRNTLTSDDDENDPEQAILYEKDDNKGFPEKMGARVPIGQVLAQLKAKDDDPKKMEGMLMEDIDIPLNLRLLHIQTSEGDDLIIEDRRNKN